MELDEDAAQSEEELTTQQVDLTEQQVNPTEVGGVDTMDDFDLLEATIDPSDLKTLRRVR